MPRRSKVELSPETISELESQFYDFIDSLTSAERKKFFAEFLTEEEKMMMYKRLALYWSLLEGYSLAKIQQMIGVTHDTTRVYNKKKNTLSEEFKELIGRIGGADEESASENEPQTQPSYEQQYNQPSQQFANETPTAEPVITYESTNEPAEEVMEEPKEIIHDLNLDEEKEDEVKMEKADESIESVKEQQTSFEETTIETREYEGESRSHEDDSAPQMQNLNQESTPTFESTESTASQEVFENVRQETERMESQAREENEDENEDNEQQPKKKSGLAKFFGF